MIKGRHQDEFLVDGPLAGESMDAYSGVIFVGGEGALELATNADALRLAREAAAQDKLIGAWGHSVAILARARRAARQARVRPPEPARGDRLGRRQVQPAAARGGRQARHLAGRGGRHALRQGAGGDRRDLIPTISTSALRSSHARRRGGFRLRRVRERGRRGGGARSAATGGLACRGDGSPAIPRRSARRLREPAPCTGPVHKSRARERSTGNLAARRRVPVRCRGRRPRAERSAGGEMRLWALFPRHRGYHVRPGSAGERSSPPSLHRRPGIPP